jgi:hypothetical protein
MDNAVSMPLMKLRRGFHLHLSRSAPRMHAGEVESTRHHVMSSVEEDHLASPSSSESVATTALRQTIESGHAVSLASIAEHPINKISACA